MTILAGYALCQAHYERGIAGESLPLMVANYKEERIKARKEYDAMMLLRLMEQAWVYNTGRMTGTIPNTHKAHKKRRTT